MESIVLYKYIIIFCFSVVLSIVMNSIFLKLSRNYGRRNTNEALIRWSSVSKPALGGISFYIIFMITYMVYTIIFQPILSGFNIALLGFLITSGMAFLMGLSDDAYNTNPLLKLLVQIACALVLIVSGTYISIFELQLFNYLFTIVWVVAVMNSINMLDNMDSITTLVSLFIILSAISIALFTPIINHFYITALIGVSGSLIGFLFFNWNPSKMFMGDTGSQFLGVFLAAIGIIYFWENHAIDFDQKSHVKQLIIVLIAFSIPISDTLTVIINRLRRGQSPFVGGKDHSTHHLSYLGLSDRNVAQIFVSISIVNFILVYLIINVYIVWSITHTLVFSSWLLIVFGLLFASTQMSKSKAKFKEINEQ